MSLLPKLILFIFLAISFNLPFGLYRAKTRAFSLNWWLAIHIPIPFIVTMRSSWLFDLPMWVIPISLISAVLGQVVGGLLASVKWGRERNRDGLAPEDQAVSAESIISLAERRQQRMGD